MNTKNCVVCGNAFIAKVVTAKYCPACRKAAYRAQKRKHYENNREYYREHQREYYTQNREYYREYYTQNLEYYREYRRKHYENNREYYREYYENNRDKLKRQRILKEMARENDHA